MSSHFSSRYHSINKNGLINQRSQSSILKRFLKSIFTTESNKEIPFKKHFVYKKKHKSSEICLYHENRTFVEKNPCEISYIQTFQTNISINFEKEDQVIIIVNEHFYRKYNEYFAKQMFQTVSDVGLNASIYMENLKKDEKSCLFLIG